MPIPVFFKPFKQNPMETILIQDADEAIADVVITALSMKGYRACHLSDIHENILETIRSHGAKLILLDCWLGQQSVRLCGWIKAHFPNLPVVAFSCDNNTRENFRVLGFDAYLGKPFELEELYRVVRKFLSGHKKSQLVEAPLDC
jgi:DNA-binding response OmpR family regulator